MTVVSTNVWFGGRLLAYEDRLQSVGKYFPYGEDRYNPNPPNPANDQEKFATYTRDAVSGLDFAVNRYYSAGLGRFMSADPYSSTAGSREPQGWNRYPYAQGDPVNHYDPKGLFACDPDDVACDPCDDDGLCDDLPDRCGNGPYAALRLHSFGRSASECDPDPRPDPGPTATWELSVGYTPVATVNGKHYDHLFIWVHEEGISAAQANASDSMVFDGGQCSIVRSRRNPKHMLRTDAKLGKCDWPL